MKATSGLRERTEAKLSVNRSSVVRAARGGIESESVSVSGQIWMM